MAFILAAAMMLGLRAGCGKKPAEIYCTVSGPFDVHVPKMRLPDEPEE